MSSYFLVFFFFVTSRTIVRPILNLNFLLSTIQMQYKVFDLKLHNVKLVLHWELGGIRLKVLGEV